MPVISNTSPLLNLAIIDQLDLLRQQFGEILRPKAVLEELRVEEMLPGSDHLREALVAGWLQVREVNNPSLVQLLQRDLDRGEAEAIALALLLDADWIILDERDGRRIAKSFGLQVTGILGIEDYNQAIKFNPNDADAYYNRGIVYASLEDKFQGISDFKQAAKLYQQQGNNEDYQDALNRIRKLQQ